MRGLEAIFFDFDGVLIDSEPVHWACWREVLLPLGVVLDWEFYRDHCIGIDDRDMLRMMAGERDWRDLWAEYPRKKELFRARIQGFSNVRKHLGSPRESTRFLFCFLQVSP